MLSLKQGPASLLSGPPIVPTPFPPKSPLPTHPIPHFSRLEVLGTAQGDKWIL